MKIINYDELTLELARKGCLVLSMPNEAYHAYDGISKSGLDLIARSPAHYAYRDHREPTRAMAIGSATHAAILEPDVFASEYMLLRDVKDRRASAYKEAVKTHGEDKVLTGKEADSVIGMQSALHMNPEAKALLDADGWTEIACFATDPETGILVKCKFDKLLKDLRAPDLKTTLDLRDFAKSVANYRYHVQQAFYSDVFSWAAGLTLKEFQFLAIEKDAPHASRLFTLDDPSVEYGRKLYREALNVYAECLRADEWPLPDGRNEYITLPAWAADPELQEF